MKNVHSYIIEYLTHDTIGHVNRYEVNNSYLTMDEIVKYELIGSSKNDYPIEIVSVSIDGKKISPSGIKKLNSKYFSDKLSECDGGAIGGGAAAGDSSPAGDSSTSGNLDGIHIEDVLGKNEPGKGYMGPGNFYIPSKVKVPLHRYEIANGGSKRKKTKTGKTKKYSYEKGMKIVVDMLESGDASKLNTPKIKKRLSKISSNIKNMDDIKKINAQMNKDGGNFVDKLSNTPYASLKTLFTDFGSFIKDVVTGEYKASWFAITMIATGLAYILSPIDIIPDVIPITGIIDDVFVLKLIYDAIKDEFNTWKLNKGNN